MHNYGGVEYNGILYIQAPQCLGSGNSFLV